MNSPTAARGLRHRLVPLVRARPGGVGLAVFVAIGLLVLGRVLARPGDLFAGYGGDAEQYMWYLGWFWHAVTTGHNPLITHLFNYPAGINLMWNTSILAESTLLGPFALLFGTTATYNAWFFLDLVLAGVLGRALLLELGVSAWLGVLGGTLIELMPFVTTQGLSHISLITTAPVLGGAVILVRAWRGRLDRPTLWGALFGLLVAIQFYTLIEVLVSAALVLAIALAIAWLVHRPLWCRFWRALPTPFIRTAAVVGGALLLPGLGFMFLGADRVFRAVQPGGLYVSDLLNFIAPTHAFLVHLPGPDPANFFTGNFAEDNAYLGVFALALLGWALRRLWHRRTVRAAAFTAASVAVLSMGQSLHAAGIATPLRLPWFVIDHIPLVHDLLPVRLMFYVDLLVVGLIVLGLQDFLRTPRGAGLRERWPQWAAGLLVISWIPVLPYPATALPAAGVALRPGTAVYAALSGHPTFVLTPAFAEMMAALGDSGYSIPVANVYGHNNNDLRRSLRLGGMGVLMTPDLPPSAYTDAITYDLLRLRVQRLVFLPRPYYNKPGLSQAALQSLYDALGPPIASSPEGAIVWRVPLHWSGSGASLLRTEVYGGTSHMLGATPGP